MATTNIPTQSRDLSEDRQRRFSEQSGDATKRDNTSSGGVTYAENDLDAQAREAVEHRANLFFDGYVANARIRLNEELKTADPSTRERREKEFMHNVDQLRKEAVDKAMAVYEGAKERRGEHQAALDQLQGAVGLPADPELRQREIERRGEQSDAAMSAQSGVGTVMDHLEGRMLGSRIDEYRGDQTRAEFNPHVQQGHGQNIANQAEAARRLQQLAPNAPMTQENVNDPIGAMKRTSQSMASQQAAEPVQGRNEGGRIDQRGGPGGHPATEGGLMGSDPLLGRSAEDRNKDRMPNAFTEDSKAGDLSDQRRKRLQEQGKQQGLSEEQLRRREQLASGADPE